MSFGSKVDIDQQSIEAEKLAWVPIYSTTREAAQAREKQCFEGASLAHDCAQSQNAFVKKVNLNLFFISLFA
tara:strand:- start:139 stop:354 length:216 start_codon:yes stop_codon:yes gene_type:complete